MKLFGDILPFIGFSSEAYQSVEEVPEGIMEGADLYAAMREQRTIRPGFTDAVVFTKFFEVGWLGYSFRYVREIIIYYKYPVEGEE